MSQQLLDKMIQLLGKEEQDPISLVNNIVFYLPFLEKIKEGEEYDLTGLLHSKLPSVAKAPLMMSLISQSNPQIIQEMGRCLKEIFLLDIKDPEKVKTIAAGSCLRKEVDTTLPYVCDINEVHSMVKSVNEEILLAYSKGEEGGDLIKKMGVIEEFAVACSFVSGREEYLDCLPPGEVKSQVRLLLKSKRKEVRLTTADFRVFLKIMFKGFSEHNLYTGSLLKIKWGRLKLYKQEQVELIPIVKEYLESPLPDMFTITEWARRALKKEIREQVVKKVDWDKVEKNILCKECTELLRENVLYEKHDIDDKCGKLCQLTFHMVSAYTKKKK